MPEKRSAPATFDALLLAIGHICLQWALIEQTLLGIIAAAENILLEKTYTRYGGTDMLPRLNLAIRLVEEAKWAPPLVQRLRSIRKAVQKDIEKRNLFVHGVHKGEVAPGQFELTMARWAANDRTHVVTPDDAIALALRLSRLAQEVDSIFKDYGTRKFGIKDHADRGYEVTDNKAASRLIRRRNIKRALKLLWANLKG